MAKHPCMAFLLASNRASTIHPAICSVTGSERLERTKKLSCWHILSVSVAVFALVVSAVVMVANVTYYLNEDHMLERLRFFLLPLSSTGWNIDQSLNFSAKHGLAISKIRRLPTIQGLVKRSVVGSLEDIPASISAATRCALGN